ncbi:MAG TPA: hypothetical protein VK689_03175, partial [Armatimonadota bacterium]|nr:hypothetical protein [Armatimonadota bacterium]
SVVAPLFGGLHEDSPLSVLLNNPNLTPEDQVNVTLGLMQSGLTNSLPPALLSAILATGDVRGSEFIRNKMKGGQGTYQDWLRNSGLDEMLGI